MQSSITPPLPKVVVGYSAYSWKHALTVLRLVEPIQRAGLQFLRGNHHDSVDLEQISLADVVVIQRDFPRWKESYDRVMTRARAERKPVIYEIDDLLLELPHDHPDVPIHYYTPALFSMLQAIIEADAVTATTAPLCAYLRPLNPNTWLLPNYLNDYFWPVNGRLSKTDSSPVVIGYMGSNTHKTDLESLTPVFISLTRRYGDTILLRFWGGEPPEEVRAQPNVEWIPLQMSDYREFAAYFSQQQADVFIAPLKDNLFNRCKSPIKYLEYSSLGIPGVYSQVSPYEAIIQDRENGFLATSAEEWEQHLAELIENSELRLQMGRKALETVRNGWLLSEHAHEWFEVFGRACSLSEVERHNNLRQNGIIVRTAVQVQDWQRKLEDELRAVKLQLAEKDRLEAELQNIYQSNGWAFLQRLLGFRRWLIPEGSWREKMFRSLFRNSS
ncbi:MAG TPA: glycosyltransferase [Anaerolineales bacterium]